MKAGVGAQIRAADDCEETPAAPSDYREPRYRLRATS